MLIIKGTFHKAISQLPGKRHNRIMNKKSELKQWPIQLHLIDVNSTDFKGCDLLLAADCTAYAMGDFHQNLLLGKKLAIACPKLDSEKEIYFRKLIHLIDQSEISTLTVAIMEVPCCRALYTLIERVISETKRDIPIKKVVVGINGEIISREWL